MTSRLTPAGMVTFALFGLGWYAVAWAGWGDTFVKQHLIGRYLHNLAGGLVSGGAYSRRPWYYHAFFYPQHLPAIVWPWSPFVAVTLWQLWRQGQALAAAGRVGPPLATATGRVGALERATLVLAEGTTPP